MKRNLSGMTLIELLVAVGILVVLFVGFLELFQSSVRYLTSARARETAASLVVEKMENIRALPYLSIGTSGGIPSGTLPQNEIISLDGVTYNRRTLIEYVDDPADGSGAADSNGIAADYKRAKVEVSWFSYPSTSSVAMTSNFIPQGIESNAGGGTLSITAIDSHAAPLQGATVRITNNVTSPAIDVTTFTNSSGAVFFPGSPSASGYHIVVSKSGYSTAQTYPVSGSNANPNPGDLTIATGLTTASSFAIDALASLSVRTLTPILPATTTDLLTDTSGIAQQSGTRVSGGVLTLLSDPDLGYGASGNAYATTTAPSYLSKWTTLSWHQNTPLNTGVLLHLYTLSDGVYTLISDSDLPGNSTGFSSSPVSLTSLATSTYASLVIGAILSTADASSTPSIQDWSLSYKAGPTPLPSVGLLLQGTKTIGTTVTDAPIYKNSQVITTNANAQYSTTTLEWDTYTLTPSGSSYDLTSSCPVEPFAIPAGSSSSVDLFLLPHTSNTLAVSIRDAATGAVLYNANALLTRVGYADTETSDYCGGAFFSSLTSASDYTLTVSASGYTTKILNNVSVAGQTTISVSL